MVKTRLDALLVERGLFESRSRAAAAVMAGEVRLGGEGARAPKPGQLVAGDVELRVAEGRRYASRGGTKLARGLDALGLDPRGRHCLDVGASTGGFTDCLLERGAERVVAVDVGYGELTWRLRQDPRVEVRERTNARRLRPESLPYAPDLAVLDVSFISLAKVLGPVVRCLSERFDVVALVKPQFELGPHRVGRGGVVREPEARREAIVAVTRHARDELGCALLGCASSGLPGPAGNRESFLWLTEGGRAGALSDPEAAARRAEP
ncbi:MAG: RNA binding methyltransferase FtsJ like [uncultured Solirubrobacterales bacterium]|uniref:RNA binding methyltransferase FtsJ like n=1 Tax=uncultured Solirubrobacterales bacterium TaxID=768556 RepID=A0A6J4RRD2_9ACTN|nr:MAG: RNA binding methyltransferase FtsJ like [uncultured Solirubrobacterales bacterium]